MISNICLTLFSSFYNSLLLFYLLQKLGIFFVALFKINFDERAVMRLKISEVAIVDLVKRRYLLFKFILVALKA